MDKFIPSLIIANILALFFLFSKKRVGNFVEKYLDKIAELTKSQRQGWIVEGQMNSRQFKLSYAEGMGRPPSAVPAAVRIEIQSSAEITESELKKLSLEFSDFHNIRHESQVVLLERFRPSMDPHKTYRDLEKLDQLLTQIEEAVA